MRLAAVSGAMLAAGCSSTPTDSTQAVDRACGVTDCFLEREVRDFEVLDRTTLIVYVGAQRCAFQVELRGTFCDLTFAPDVFFREPNNIQDPGSRRSLGGPPQRDDPFSRAIGDQSRDLRICDNDIQIDVDGGVFTESLSSDQPLDRFGNRRSQCQVNRVESLTDDELVELYVARGVVAPPPPMGSGEITVEDNEDEPGEEQGEQTPDDTAAPDGTTERADPAARLGTVPEGEVATTDLQVSAGGN